MASIIKTYNFKNGRTIDKDGIDYANGEFVSLEDYKIEREKKFCLESKLDKYVRLRSRFTDSALRDFDSGDYASLSVLTISELSSYKDRIEELENEIHTMDCFSAPLDVVKMLTSATCEVKNPFIERPREIKKYTIDELVQIAEYLLVYCKHNKEDE